MLPRRAVSDASTIRSTAGADATASLSAFTSAITATTDPVA